MIRAKRKTGRTTIETAHSDSNLYSVLQLEASSPTENYYTSKAISVVVRTRM